MGIDKKIREEIEAVVGPKGLVESADDMAPYLADWRGGFSGSADLVVLPGSTEEVAAVVKICARAGLPIVPQGGNTGLTRAGIPPAEGGMLVMSLRRMDRVREIDAKGFTMTVEAGAVLQSIQEAAAAEDRLFPLSLGAEGSCRIGGNISTNAGGIHVLRYGNTRELVLGLEVVLPSGEVWDGLTRLRKDNTGYDLKQLFMGAEGSLGIITAASLRLFPRPKAVETAFIGLASVGDALALLARLQEANGDQLVAFEIFPRQGLELILEHIPGTRDPLAETHPWYVLTEFWSTRPDNGAAHPLQAAMEQSLAEAAEAGLISDAAIIASEQQRKDVWRLREAFAEALRAAAMLSGGGLAFDLSVPVALIPEFVEKADAALNERIPGLLTVPFGHAGDGNIHYNIGPGPDNDAADFAAKSEEIYRLVHDITVSFGGSISAEHGIGRLRREELAHYKEGPEIEMMRTLKAAIDPQGIMNPGVIV